MSTDKENYDVLNSLHNSTNVAFENLQKENEVLKSEIIIMNMKLDNAQKNVDINKEITLNNILATNLMKEDFAKEIEILRAKIAVLEK